MGKAPDAVKSPFATYRLQRAIAGGGSGRVYEVKDESGQTHALKILDPSKATTDKRKRFKNELNFCSKADSENVLCVTDWGTCEFDGKEAAFYVMPHFPETLRTMMMKRIPPKEVLGLYAQLLNGVEYAHLRNVVHRDIKPENVLYNSANRQLVVADFGIARFAEDDLITAVETQRADRMANFQYSAPEQRVRGRAVTLTADIFALGLILNEMFTGEIPQGSSYVTIAATAPEYGYLDDIVSAMIQQNPASRPQSIDVVKRQLIVRGADAVSRQKLDELSKRVVPVGTITDPLALEPLRVVSTDYKNGRLIFRLSRGVNHAWVNCFHEIGGYISSAPPTAFEFNDDMASVPLGHPNYAADIKKWLESNYLPQAMTNYRNTLERVEQIRAREERERLENQRREEEIRRDILNSLNRPAS